MNKKLKVYLKELKQREKMLKNRARELSLQEKYEDAVFLRNQAYTINTIIYELNIIYTN